MPKQQRPARRAVDQIRVDLGLLDRIGDMPIPNPPKTRPLLRPIETANTVPAPGGRGRRVKKIQISRKRLDRNESRLLRTPRMDSPRRDNMNSARYRFATYVVRCATTVASTWLVLAYTSRWVAVIIALTIFVAVCRAPANVPGDTIDKLARLLSVPPDRDP